MSSWGLCLQSQLQPLFHNTHHIPTKTHSLQPFSQLKSSFTSLQPSSLPTSLQIQSIHSRSRPSTRSYPNQKPTTFLSPSPNHHHHALSKETPLHPSRLQTRPGPHHRRLLLLLRPFLRQAPHARRPPVHGARGMQERSVRAEREQVDRGEHGRGEGSLIIRQVERERLRERSWRAAYKKFGRSERVAWTLM